LNPIVSIITICYNCRADLEKTLLSVASQTYADKEYVIVDGGSTDGTAELLQTHRGNIDLLISEPDDGIYDALNKGIRAAKGEWVICMNAGDTFTSDHVLENIFSRPIPDDITFIYSDFILLHADGRQELRKTDREQGEVHHQNAIYRKRLHERYGYYIVTPTYIVSDLLFFLAVPPQQFRKINTPIAFVKDGGISNGLWCSAQAMAAKVVFGLDTIPHIFYRYTRLRFGLWRQKVLGRLKKRNR
jgi:glycosyltransferase involved in cell wall biosynthesis